MLRFNHVFLKKTNGGKKFQYILCCGSTITELEVEARETRFQYILCCGSTPFGNCRIPEKNISIHLMLRFNFKNQLPYAQFIGISIHLMLRFNLEKWFLLLK